MKLRKSTLLFSAAIPLLAASPAGAVTQLIGDIDGFGIAPSGLVRATPAPHDQPADTDGDGIIEPGEFLPDLNHDGAVSGVPDTFDQRSAAEAAATTGASVDGPLAPGHRRGRRRDVHVHVHRTDPGHE